MSILPEAKNIFPHMVLPFLGKNTPTINSKQLQRLSGNKLTDLENGPQIIEINGVKQAVLVDYDQFENLEKRFHQIVNKLGKFSQVFALLKIPADHELLELRVDIEATLRKIVSEIPESSPFVEYMDSLLGLTAALYEKSVNAPKEMKEAIVNRNVEDVEVEEISERPTRNFTK